MEVHRSALVAHPAERLFALIEAAENYPAFLPWCAGATILQRDDQVVVARIEVAWHGLRFGFVTRNPKRAPHWMAIGLESGPFKRFEGEWKLAPLSEWGCRVEFLLRYEFDAAVLGKLATPVFDRATQTLVDAFIRRADETALPAPPPASSPSSSQLASPSTTPPTSAPPPVAPPEGASS